MVIVKRKELSLAERLYLPEIARALGHSIRAIFKPKITRRVRDINQLTHTCGFHLGGKVPEIDGTIQLAAEG